MNKILVAIFFTISLSSLYGQESGKMIIDNFFNLYEEDAIKAIDYIYGTNDYFDINGDAVKKLKGQLKQFVDLVGNYKGNELLYKSDISKYYETYIYLVRYDRQPVRFTFSFYKPDKNWFLYSFKFDDSFDNDLEEVMKYEYFRNRFE